jgi:hypothetical protein
MASKKQSPAAEHSQALTAIESRVLASFRKLNDETRDFYAAYIEDCAADPQFCRSVRQAPAKPVVGTNVYALHGGVKL